MKKNILFLAFVITITNLQAQVKVEEQVTITASNTVQKIQRTGRNIIVIPGSLYANLAINSVDELLKYANGIEVQQRGVQGSQSDILMRGGTFQQVLILLDGIRLNDPLTGHFNGNIPIHPNEIDRIEILKGPASAVWGADAVGGVIHIITKAFTNKTKSAMRVNAGFQFGQFGLINANVSAAGQSKNGYYSIGLLSNNAKGPEARGTSGYFNNNTLHGAIQTKLESGWNLSLKTVLDGRDFNAQNFYTTFVSDTAKETVNSFFNHIQLSKTWGNRSITNDLSYKSLSDEFQFNNLGTPNKNRTKQLIYQFNIQDNIDERTKYSTGVQIMNRSIKSNDRGNHTLTSAGAYFTLNHDLQKNWYMNESIRFDYNENFGTVMSPQISLIYNPNEWSFRAAYAKGIRDADFTERFNNYNKTLVTSGSIGNPNLKTENTWNIELGADYIKNGLKLSTTAFYRNQSNLIDWATTPFSKMPRTINLIPTGSYALATNLSEVITSGIELDLNYNAKIDEKQNLIVNYNLTYLKSKTDQTVTSFYIVGHANWISTLNTIYSFDNLSVAINALYKNRPARTASSINASISKEYFLVNVKAAYSVKKSNMQIFAQATNIGDTQYSDILGAQMPGRWLSGGLQINL